MATRRGSDKYSNLMSARVDEVVTGDMNYQEILTGISLGAGVGLLIDQIDYTFAQGTINDLVLESDSVHMGWFTQNTLAAFNIGDNRQIHSESKYGPVTIGTNAGGWVPITTPDVYQFFPPMIVASPRLFLGIQGLSLAAEAVGWSRLYFRYIDLSSQEYLELAEAFVLVG